MVLSPAYEVKIPNDPTVVLETSGVLGETFVEIDATSASDPPIGANAVLGAKPTVQLTTQQIIGKFGEVVRKKDWDCDTKKGRCLWRDHCEEILFEESFALKL